MTIAYVLVQCTIGHEMEVLRNLLQIDLDYLIISLGKGNINLHPFFLISFSLNKISFLKCQGKTK